MTPARDDTSGPRDAAAPGDDDVPPPALGSWRRWYALVLGALAVTIALLGLLGHHYGHRAP